MIKEYLQPPKNKVNTSDRKVKELKALMVGQNKLYKGNIIY
jgi:hypothetical protein